MTKTKDGYKDTMKNLCYANFLGKKCKKKCIDRKRCDFLMMVG